MSAERALNEHRMSTDLQIRSATVADVAAAARLLLAHHAERGDPVDGDDVARAVELALAPRALAWLAIAARGGMPVGVVLANPVISPRHGGAALRIEALYVAPAHRRRGVARALVEHLAGASRTAGLRALEADARPGDAAALALGRSLGFTIDERRAMVRRAA